MQAINGDYYADAFVAKLNASGSELAYATFLGGGSDDYGWGIAIGEVDRAYVVGYTRSPELPHHARRVRSGLERLGQISSSPSSPWAECHPRPRPTPTQTPTPTATPTRTPTPTAVPWPDLAASRKAAWPASVAYQQSIFYDVYLRNTGGAPAQVALVDAPPLPYVPDSAWGGLWWDPNTETLRWQGNLQIGEGRYFGYSLSGPSSLRGAGDGLHQHADHRRRLPSAVRAQRPGRRRRRPDACGVMYSYRRLPTATPTATATATDTPTITPTSTATPTPMHGYLPLILHR